MVQSKPATRTAGRLKNSGRSLDWEQWEAEKPLRDREQGFTVVEWK